MNFYRDERKKKKRRRMMKIKIFCAAAVFLALIIGVVYLAAYSQFFTIRKVEVEISGSDDGRVNKADLIRDLGNFFSNQSKITSFLGPDNILIWDSGKLIRFPK